MSRFAIIDSASGEIMGFLSGPGGVMPEELKEGQLAVEANESIRDTVHMYVDGVFVDKPPESYTHLNTAALFDMRRERRMLLAHSDWTQVADAPLTDTVKAEWLAYRNALRDLPSVFPNITDLSEVVWPTPPS